MKTRELALGALLAALALVIPLAFSFLRVTLPPFTATLTSHVPVMLALLVSPIAALAAGVGSTIGFIIAASPVVAARAAIHIVWGVLGAVAYRRGMQAWAVLLLMLPVHALGEAFVVLPFGYTLASAGLVVGVGTALHHLVDMGVTLLVFAALTRLGVRLQSKA